MAYAAARCSSQISVPIARLVNLTKSSPRPPLRDGKRSTSQPVSRSRRRRAGYHTLSSPIFTPWKRLTHLSLLPVHGLYVRCCIPRIILFAHYSLLATLFSPVSFALSSPLSGNRTPQLYIQSKLYDVPRRTLLQIACVERTRPERSRTSPCPRPLTFGGPTAASLNRAEAGSHGNFRIALANSGSLLKMAQQRSHSLLSIAG